MSDREIDLSKPLTLTNPLAAATDQTVDDDGTVTIEVGTEHAGATVDVGVSRVSEDDRELQADGGQPHNPVDARLNARPPSPIEQAKAAAFDDPTRLELTNMLYGLPCTFGVLVDGEDEQWRPTRITVEFDRDDFGRATGDVLTIMRRAGWELQSVTFGRPQLHFEPVDERRAGETEVIETYCSQKDDMAIQALEELEARVADEVAARREAEADE